MDAGGVRARCRTPPVAIRSRNRFRRIHLTSFATRSAVAGAVLAAAAAAGVVSATGCRPSADQAKQTTADSAAAGDSTIVVMNAASMTKPLTIVLDSFAARTGIHYQIEPGASLEVARRITELGRRPDVVALADPEVFPNLLMPRYTTWYAVFGRNRIVLAYTDTSKFAHQVTPLNWVTVIQRPGVQVGRADPNTDPSGYRTLLVFQLAERYYHKTGLAAALLAAAPPRNVRPREADQVALLQSGDLDYILDVPEPCRSVAAQDRHSSAGDRPGHSRGLGNVCHGVGARRGQKARRHDHGAWRTDPVCRDRAHDRTAFRRWVPGSRSISCRPMDSGSCAQTTSMRSRRH